MARDLNAVWKFVRRWSSRIWLLLVAVFIGLTLYSQKITLPDLFAEAQARLILASLTFILLGKALTIFLVRECLGIFNQRRGFRYVWYAYSIGDISKYVPGGVWGIAGRLAIYKSSGIPFSQGTKILLLETFILIFASFFTGLAFALAHQSMWWVCGSIAAFACLVYLLTALTSFSLYRSLGMVATQVLSWIVFGASFAILLPQSIERFCYLIGIFDISFAAGTLVVFAPSGIGIRELVLTSFGSLDIRLLLQVGVLHRLIWLACDVIVFLPTIFLKQDVRDIAALD